MPRPAGPRPVAAPWRRAVAVAAVGAHLRRRERRRRPRDPLDRAAFLVDGDQERRLAAGSRRRRGSWLVSARRARRRRDVPAEQDHAADLAAPDPAEQAGARRRPSIATIELLADQLREVRHGRAADDRRRTGGRERRAGRRHGWTRAARSRRSPGSRAATGPTQTATIAPTTRATTGLRIVEARSSRRPRMHLDRARLAGPVARRHGRVGRLTRAPR